MRGKNKTVATFLNYKVPQSHLQVIKCPDSKGRQSSDTVSLSSSYRDTEVTVTHQFRYYFLPTQNQVTICLLSHNSTLHNCVLSTRKSVILFKY